MHSTPCAYGCIVSYYRLNLRSNDERAGMCPNGIRCPGYNSEIDRESWDTIFDPCLDSQLLQSMLMLRMLNLHTNYCSYDAGACPSGSSIRRNEQGGPEPPRTQERQACSADASCSVLTLYFVSTSAFGRSCIRFSRPNVYSSMYW